MLTEVFAVSNHTWTHRKAVGEVISNFLNNQSDGLYEVTIKKFSAKRSGQQNRYYWKLLEYLCPAIGYESKDSLHVMLMQECGFGKYVEFRGKQYFERKSSTDLDKETFGKLIDKCFEIAAFLNEDRDHDQRIVFPAREP